VERTGARLGCLLNADSLVIRRTAGVRPVSAAGGPLAGAKLSDDPLLFTGGGTTELTLDLLFDVTLAGSSIATEDVRDLTRPLWELAENTAEENGIRRPPLVRFVWGKSWNILGVVTAAAERLEYFTPAGAPRRSWLRLRLVRVDEAQLRQSAPAAQRSRAPIPQVTPDTMIPPRELRVHEVVGGGSTRDRGAARELGPTKARGSARERGPGRPAERLDEIANREYGDPRYWRVIAALNKVADPARLPEGQRLVIGNRTAFERQP
jgi:hypothetical protein